MKANNCYFCGEKITERDFARLDRDPCLRGDSPVPAYSVKCRECGASGPLGYGLSIGDHSTAKDKAVQRWNDARLTAEIALTDKIDEIEKYGELLENLAQVVLPIVQKLNEQGVSLDNRVIRLHRRAWTEQADAGINRVLGASILWI